MNAGTSGPFDAIIIGSGLGGLISGALLAQAGKRVQLLERHDKFGGAATNFKRRDLQVEVSLCLLDGLDAMDFKTPVFHKLGLFDSVSFVSTKIFYNLRHPLLGEDFVMPCGFKEAIDACILRFPRHEKGIRTYFSTIRKLRNTKNNLFLNQLQTGNTPLKELADAYRCGLRGEGDEHPSTHPLTDNPTDALMRAKKISMSRFLQSLFGDDEAIKFALCANVCFFTSNLDTMSIFEFALSQASYHYGVYYVHRGSQKLSDSLVEIIRDAGGETWNRREVTRILVHEGRAVGVEHRQAAIIGSPKAVKHVDTQSSYAKLILGNATPGAIKNLLPKPFNDIFFNVYDGIPAQTSIWTIYLGFNRKPSHYGVRHYGQFIYPRWLDSMKKYKDSCEVMGQTPGSRVPPFMFCDYSQLDEMITADGQCLGILNWIDLLGNWHPMEEEIYERRKEQWLDVLINALDQAFPGIKESIVYREMATPRTVRAYLNDPEGVVHGFEDPELMKLGKTFRHGPMTNIDGLLLASSFAFLGPGYSKAILAGTVAADQAFRELQKN
ncbi:MAG: putative FAD dependent oxidoreductase [Magnetococcales bacterium]|nr:putative FAD dependent oxidoreductase [Magnetococcales bacterium]